MAGHEQAPQATMLDATPGFPSSRAVCEGGNRPCRWTTCRQHLWSIQDRPGRRGVGRALPPPVVQQHSEQTCALDVIDKEPDGLSRRDVAKLMGMTPERVRQLEHDAQDKLELGLHRLDACPATCWWCARERERRALAGRE